MGRYPRAQFLLLEVLHLVILYPTRRNACRVVALAARIYVTARIFQTPGAADPPSVGYTMGCMIANRFMFMVYLLFAEGTFPDHWRRVRDEVHAKADASGLDSQPSNFPLTKKFWWMVDIAYSVRMIGWVQEPQNGIPPRPPPSRRVFLRKTAIKLIINTVIADFATSALALSPAFDRRVHDATDGPETYLAAVPFLRRAPYVLAFGMMSAAVAGILHNVLALVCVGLCHSSPTLWPDVWGRWGDAYTVRKFWGCVC